MSFIYILLVLSMLASVIPKGKGDAFPLIFWGGALVWAVFFFVTHATTVVRINI